MFASSSSTSIAKGSEKSNDLPKYGGSHRLSDGSKQPLFLIFLVAVKVCASLAIFLLAEFLQSVTKRRVGGHGDSREVTLTTSFVPPSSGDRGLLGKWSMVIQTMAIIQLTSGIAYCIVQKPFKKLKLSSTHWIKIFRHSLILILFLLIWICGLILTGPFHTVLISAHYDYTLAGILSGFFVVKTGARLRGAFLFVAGLLLLLLFDDISSFHSTMTTVRPTMKSTVLPGQGNNERTYLSKNSTGIMTLLLYLVFKLGFDAFSKNVAVDFGGEKRLNALTASASGGILFLIVIVDLFMGGSGIPFAGSNIVTLMFVICFGFVFNYYVDQICLKRMEAWKVARIGTLASHISALIYSLLWITLDEVPTFVTALSFLLIGLGTWSLTSSERASGGGNLIGFANDGLPLFSFSSHFSFSSSSASSSLLRNLLALLTSFYRQVQEDRMSRRIFTYFLLVLAFTFVELVGGAFTNSLGLVSDGFHMLFDSMAIFIGLSASVIARWKAGPGFPFGYGRIEVLSGFLNAFFLMIAAASIFVEAWTRLLTTPPEVDAHQTLLISCIGLGVNLIGIYAFRNSSGVEHTHVHENANIRGVFLHILADTLGSLGVITSSILIKQFGLFIADPICSLLLSLLIFRTAWPLLKDTALTLLLTIPLKIEKKMPSAVLSLLSIEGVKGYKNLRFFTQSPSFLTGSIQVQATQDANEQLIIRGVTALFSTMGFTHFTTQVEKDEFIASKSSSSEELKTIEIVGIGPKEEGN